MAKKSKSKASGLTQCYVHLLDMSNRITHIERGFDGLSNSFPVLMDNINKSNAKFASKIEQCEMRIAELERLLTDKKNEESALDSVLDKMKMDS